MPAQACPWCKQVFYRAPNYARHKATCSQRREKHSSSFSAQGQNCSTFNDDSPTQNDSVNFHEDIVMSSEFAFQASHGERSDIVQSQGTVPEEGPGTITIDTETDGFSDDTELEDHDADDYEDILPSDMFGLALRDESIYGERVLNHSDARGLEDLHVTYMQYKSALYITTSGASLKGLSEQEASFYLRTFRKSDPPRQKWPNGRSFWIDHKKRQALVLPKVGSWLKFELKMTRRDVPTQIAYIRDIVPTVRHVIKASVHLKSPEDRSKDIDWVHHLHLKYETQYDKSGNRILTDWHSGDDLRYMEAAMALDEPHELLTLIPLQIFIDKANVTRLNKRSMYPVVLYILCFSRYVRRKIAVNVAFVPIVSKSSTTGGRLSDEVVKVARNSVLQATLNALLLPLKRDTVADVMFPDGVRRRCRPFLISVVLDLPEAAVCSSRRFGVSTRFGCARCFTPTELFSSLDVNSTVLKSAEEVDAMYESIALFPLLSQQNMELSKFSLRKPKSLFLTRYECNLDILQIKLRLPPHIAANPFSMHSLMKFESLHNFDLGLTKQTLESIPKFLAVSIGGAQSTKIVGIANSHQSSLPRRSQTGLFRLPTLGTAIADSHANMNAQNFFSVLSVLPFMLRGSEIGTSRGAKPIFDLISFFLEYLELHHFIRRINTLPWHMYDTLEARLLPRLRRFATLYRETIGQIRGVEDEARLATPKAHQLFFHILRNIKGGGVVQEFDAQGW